MLISLFIRAGEPGLRTHLVRRLPGPQLLSEEHADQRDANRHPVPFPDLAQPERAGEQPDAPRLPQVGTLNKKARKATGVLCRF